MVLRLVVALTLALAVLPARAETETYKWIDARGQVHYSNAPPPSAFELLQIVEQRISVSGPDPATREALARMEAALEQRRQVEAQEWLQRQRAMAVDCGYGGCGGSPAPSYTSSPQFLPNYYGGWVYNAVAPRHVYAHMSRPGSASYSRPTQYAGSASHARPTPHAGSASRSRGSVRR